MYSLRDILSSSETILRDQLFEIDDIEGTDNKFRFVTFKMKKV